MRQFPEQHLFVLQNERHGQVDSCSGSQTSGAGLANIALGELTIIANISAAGLTLTANGLTFHANSLQTSARA